MDLLQCPGCRQRFLITDAGSGWGWCCPNCRGELEPAVRSIPGSAKRISSALNARFLDPAGRLRPGTEPREATER